LKSSLTRTPKSKGRVRANLRHALGGEWQGAMISLKAQGNRDKKRRTG